VGVGGRDAACARKIKTLSNWGWIGQKKDKLGTKLNKVSTVRRQILCRWVGRVQSIGDGGACPSPQRTEGPGASQDRCRGRARKMNGPMARG